MPDFINDLRNRVLLHPTAHIQPEQRLASDLRIVRGKGTESIGVHDSAMVKLTDSATAVYGKVEDHIVKVDVGPAVLVI